MRADTRTVQESYITHIRVHEDGSFPQSPPPPAAPASNKKARIIMISVRNTGRVKLHKARENANGTFSIGKSWPMEDLSAVENYVHLKPKDEEEAQKQKWAGEKGFTVTISKPYYWEAGTAKEKEFFIGSMVKIYNKYTKGEYPILTGFSPAELSSLTNGNPQLATAEGRSTARTAGSNGDPRQPRQATPEQRPTPPMPPRSAGIRGGGPGESPPILPDDPRKGPMPGPQNPNFRRPPGEYQGPRRPGDQLRSGSRPGTGDDARRPSPLAASQATPSMPNLRQKSSMDPSIRSRPSGESVRPPPSMLGREPMPPPPQMPSQNLTPQSSTSEFANRPKTPESSNFPSSLNPARRQLGDDAQSQRSQKSVEDFSFEASTQAPPLPSPRRPNGSPAQRRDLSPPRALRPGTAQSNASSNFSRTQDMPPEEPPQRRRPFMDAARPSESSQRSTGSQGADSRSESQTREQSPAPPMEVPPRRRPQEIPERLKPAALSAMSSQDMSPQSQPTPPPTSPLPQLPIAPLSVKPEPTAKPTEQPVEQVPAVQPKSNEDEAAQSVTNAPEETESEAHRPGMGPMVKKSLATVDAASKFRKMAAAAGAFKPRAGGAAAKLFAPKETKTSDEPDGISGVFVPKREVPKEAPKEEEPKPAEEVPKLAPDRLSKERPRISTEVVPSVTVSSPLSPTPAALEPESQERTISPSPDAPATQKPSPEPEVRRKKRRSNQQITNISNLGIDPSLIDEQGLEFEGLLSELGWGSNELSAKKIESLENDLKREIARVEAGSWLNHLEQKDDRVEAVERMLDRAIAECDELEGLLTLYNVELGVSRPISISLHVRIINN
jgi:hypothetical protein